MKLLLKSHCSASVFCFFSFFIFSVAYLVIFHILFVLFVWTYWKSIFTLPVQPGKKVRVQALFIRCGVTAGVLKRTHKSFSLVDLDS